MPACAHTRFLRCRTVGVLRGGLRPIANRRRVRHRYFVSNSINTDPMKTPTFVLPRLLSTAAMSAICLLALSQTAAAKRPGDSSYGRGNSQQSRHNSANARARQAYASHPGSGFSLTFGTGYAGRGYYYGPPNSPYYYQRSDVRYYATRELAPREYRQPVYRSGSVSSAVQRELARRGFYQGYIDGQIGPQSRRAIAGYQQSRGLRPTGEINSSLLYSLGLQ